MSTARRSFPRIALVAMLLLASLPVATAQVDERARALLEGLRPPAEAVVDTLDQVMVMSVDVEGIVQVVRTRSIIDYVGRRASIVSELAPGMSVTILITDDRAQMVMGGMRLPVPEGLADGYDGIFERGAGDLLGDGASASYDGVHAYGGLVEGEQVTVSGPTGIAGIENAEQSRLLFDAQGRLLAVVADTDEGTMLMLFDEPFLGSAVVGRSATMFWLRDAGAERFATLAFEDVRINEPIAEGTFE